MSKAVWLPLTSTAQVNAIFDDKETCLIFKHSIRCPISKMVRQNFEGEWDTLPQVTCYFNDLVTYRDASNAVAARSGVRHESPQLLVIQDGVCIFNSSHESISAKDVLRVLSEGKGVTT